MRDLVLLRSTVFMTLAAIVVGGCGEKIDDVAAGGDLERYCRLVQELDTAGREADAAFEEAGSVTEQDAAQAGRDFLDVHAELIDNLGDAAPIEIATTCNSATSR